jgi:2-polyprenyl-6-methoxyphenol hydroxylase-like FAD-dependent oxidoreductase
MNKRMDEQVDVLVVGAGPVGLAMACELARHGVRCRLIDKLPSPSLLSKALAVQPRTLEIFERMGVTEAFLERGIKVHGLNAWMGSDKHVVNLHFDELDSPYPFIIDMPQYVTEAILTERLASLGMSPERGVELMRLEQAEDRATVQLRHADGREETLDAPWVIGCDGAHSVIRHQVGAEFEGSVYPESFVLADVHVAWSLPDNEIHIFLHEDGVVAAFPYGKGRYRLMGDMQMDSADGTAPEPTLEQFQQLVKERVPTAAVLSDPIWMSSFRTHLRHSKQTRYGRAFLVGDAAHIHSPAGGQGMNTGIQDAFNLAWKLARVVQGKASDALLDTYQTERLPIAESVMRMSDRLISMATLQQPLVKQIRNHLAPLLANNEIIQKRVRSQITEVSVNYRESPIVKEHRNGLLQSLMPHNLHAGDRAPDVAGLLGAAGEPHRLFELLRGTKHALLVLPAESTKHADLADGLRLWADELDIFMVAAEAVADADSRLAIIADPQNQLAQRLDADPGSLILIRPDGYVGLFSNRIDVEAVRSYFEQLSR